MTVSLGAFVVGAASALVDKFTSGTDKAALAQQVQKAKEEEAKAELDKQWADVDGFDPYTMRQDPLSVMIILSLIQDQPKNTKLRLNEFNISFQPPGLLGLPQAATRKLKGDSHKQLETIPAKIETALRWFSPKLPAINAIFQRTIWGLKTLLETDAYKSDKFFQQDVKKWIGMIEAACEKKADAILPTTPYGKAVHALWGKNTIGRIITHLNIKLPDTPLTGNSTHNPKSTAGKTAAATGASLPNGAVSPSGAAKAASVNVNAAASVALSEANKTNSQKDKKVSGSAKPDEAAADNKSKAAAGDDKAKAASAGDAKSHAAENPSSEPPASDAAAAAAEPEDNDFIGDDVHLDPKAPPSPADIPKVLDELQPILLKFTRLTKKQMLEATDLANA